MRITESKLRRIIRKKIVESIHDHSSYQAEELIEQVSYIMETGSRQDLISYLRSQDEGTIKKAMAIAIEHGDKDLENTLSGELYARRMIADYSDNKNRLGRPRYFGD